jgi:hypothetical protein
MTSLDADALNTDPEGLAFLRDVLGGDPAASAKPSRQPPKPHVRSANRPMPSPRTARRLGLIGATAVVGLIVAASPAKPTVPRGYDRPPAATEMHQQTTPETPARSRPVRAATKFAAIEADPLACPRARRKLWVDGEGWVVRSVSRC